MEPTSKEYVLGIFKNAFLGALLILNVNLALSGLCPTTVRAEPVNGDIVQQGLDAAGSGYTVMKVWGTYYQMGYAQGYLLADDIDITIASLRNAVGSSTYNYLKPQMQNTVIISDVADEVNGIVAGVKAAKPSSSIDYGDLIMLNTYSDWGVSPNCRSHSTWGSYVTPPVKTLSTRRTDYQSSEIESIFDAINILLLAYEPSDSGKVKWVNLTMPGIVVASTSVNEYGTMVSLHNSPDTGGSHATGPNVITRGIATRYALAMENLPTDMSQHADLVYNGLQAYQPWTGSFMNYYAPMGNAGVLSLSASQGFFDLRKPQPSYYGGEVIVTSNSYTDGSSTPSDATFFNSYYNDHTPKTLADHWGLLDAVTTNLGAQQLSVEYRGRADMTLWARGRLFGSTVTPIIKFEWSELFAALTATVTITTPAEGAAVIAPADVIITAQVSLPGQTVEEVSFYANETTLIGVDSTSPYSLTWADVSQGAYNLTAIARGSSGELVTSDPVAVSITDVQCLVDEQCNDSNACTVDTCVDGLCRNEGSRTVSSYPYIESFENGWSDWTNGAGDDMDWTEDSGRTPSSWTGPSGAHDGDYYVYTEASYPNSPGKTALLTGPAFDLSSTTEPMLTFWYHMYGSAMGALRVDISEDCEDWTSVWSQSGNLGNAWYQASIDLAPYSGKTITIRFRGTTGNWSRSDMAVDDIEVTATPYIGCTGDEDCDDGNFCNGAESCFEGECQSGSPVECDDGIACTDDSCSESSGDCEYVPNNAACDDGQFCNGEETCSATLGCETGSDPCIGNYCNEADQACYECERDSECDDGLFCTGIETCENGACQSGADPCPGQGQACDEDNNQCVADPSNTMHVQTIEITKQRRWWWAYRRGMARIQITDSQGSPVNGAVVAGQWSEDVDDADQMSTGPNGWVNIYSDWHWGDTTFTFCIANITKEGWVYNPGVTCAHTN